MKKHEDKTLQKNGLWVYKKRELYEKDTYLLIKAIWGEKCYRRKNRAKKDRQAFKKLYKKISNNSRISIDIPVHIIGGLAARSRKFQIKKTDGEIIIHDVYDFINISIDQDGVISGRGLFPPNNDVEQYYLINELIKFGKGEESSVKTYP